MSGTRTLLAGISSDLDLVISKTATATQSLRDHAAVAKETKASRDETLDQTEKITKAQQLATDSMTRLFSETDRLAALYPVIEQFKQGLVSANDVAQVLGGTILKVLPSDSDVQERIRSFIDAAKDGVNDLQNLTALLAEQTDRFAQMFIAQLKLLAEGKITIQQLIELGQQYSETLPDGSATGQMIDEIIDALRDRP